MGGHTGFTGLLSLLVEPAEGEDVFGSVCVLWLPLLVRLEKVNATASARTSTCDVIPERRRQLAGAGQWAGPVGMRRRAKGFWEWVELQGMSEGLAADWLRLLPVAAGQRDFLSLSLSSQLLPLHPRHQLMRQKSISGS